MDENKPTSALSRRRLIEIICNHASFSWNFLHKLESVLEICEELLRVDSALDAEKDYEGWQDVDHIRKSVESLKFDKNECIKWLRYEIKDINKLHAKGEYSLKFKKKKGLV